MSRSTARPPGRWSVTKLDARGDELWSRRDGTDHLDSAVDVVAGAWGALVLSTGVPPPSTAGTARRASRSPATTPTGRWCGPGGATTPRTMSGLAVVGDSYYVVGGSSVRRFDLATGRAASRARRQGHRAGPCHVELGRCPSATTSWCSAAPRRAPEPTSYVLRTARRADAHGRVDEDRSTSSSRTSRPTWPSPAIGSWSRRLDDGQPRSDRRRPRAAPRRLRRRRRPGGYARFPYGAVPRRACAGRDADRAGRLLHGVHHPRRPAGHDPADLRRRRRAGEPRAFVGEQYALATGTDVGLGRRRGPAGRRQRRRATPSTRPPTTPTRSSRGISDTTALLVQARLSPRRLVLRPGKTPDQPAGADQPGSGARGAGGPRLRCATRGLRLQVRTGGADVTRAVRRGTWRSAPAGPGTVGPADGPGRAPGARRVRRRRAATSRSASPAPGPCRSRSTCGSG